LEVRLLPGEWRKKNVRNHFYNEYNQSDNKKIINKEGNE